MQSQLFVTFLLSLLIGFEKQFVRKIVQQRFKDPFSVCFVSFFYIIFDLLSLLVAVKGKVKKECLSKCIELHQLKYKQQQATANSTVQTKRWFICGLWTTPWTIATKKLDHFNSKLIFALPKEKHPSKPFLRDSLTRILFYLSCTWQH